MTIDTSPGSPDGPPLEEPERTTAGEYVGRALGVSILAVALVFTVVAMVWAIAWMVTHFPGV